MKNYLWAILGCVSIILISEPALGKKALDYIPPPYYLRFIYALITVIPVAVVFCTLAYLTWKFIDSESLSISWKYVIMVAVSLACVGAIYGSLDAHNDESWNPAIDGAKPLALLVPYLAYLLTRKWFYWKRTIILIGLFILSYPATWSGAYLWQMAGESIGFPTTW